MKKFFKLNYYLFFILMMFMFENNEVNAIGTTNCRGTMARLFNYSYEDADITLKNDISEYDDSNCSDFEFTEGFYINFAENQERTIDLNGYTVELEHGFQINASEGAVLNIIDSSEEKTGKMIIPSIILESCNSAQCNSFTINVNGGTYELDTFIETYDAEGIQALNFSNSIFKGSKFVNGSLDQIKVKNSIFKPKSTKIAFMNNEYDYSLNDVIASGYKVLNNGQNIDLSSKSNELESNNNIYVIKDDKVISTSDFQKEYSDYNEAQTIPITFENIGNDSLTIKKVYITNEENFTLNGDKQLVLSTNQIDNTTYTISYKVNLPIGVYTTDVIAIDTNNNYYVSTTNFEISKKIITKPTVVSESSFKYDGNKHEISINGYDENTMIINGIQSASEIGEYSLTITPKENYYWEDETSDEITINWDIYDYHEVTEILLIGDEIIKKGNTYQYQVVISPDNATNKEVIWNVENGTGTASISEEGLLIAEKEGSITITATSKENDSIVGVKTVTIENFVPVEQIEIKSPVLYLRTQSSIYLDAIVFPLNATNKEVRWSSSDTSIATIGEISGGLATKTKYGTVIITATATDGSGVVGKIKIVVGGVYIKLGDAVSLSNSIFTNYENVVWEIDDPTIIEPTGQKGFTAINSVYIHYYGVKALKNGSTNVSMKTISGDVISSTKVNVYTPIESITSDVDKLILQPQETAKLNISLTPNDTTESLEKIFYQSNDEEIASVDQNGNVIAHKNGNTNIIIYSQYYEKSLTIPVSVVTYTTSLELDTYEVLLTDEKREHQIIYNVSPANASDKVVKFSSSDTSIATVNSNGLIRAITNGDTIITVTTNDGKQLRQVNVKIEGLKIEIESLEFNDLNDVVYNGSEYTPSVIINNANYTLLENVDYILSYENNIKVGEAKVQIKGINNYKGTKTIYFNITKANIEYISESKTLTYDGNEHSIKLNVISPNNVIIRYANENGEYILSEMPTYTNAGIYEIKYKIYVDDNYNEIYDSKFLTISKAKLEISYQSANKSIVYDGKQHGIELNILKPNNIIVKFVDVNGNYTLSEMPTYKDVGVYTIKYKLLIDNNYETIEDSKTLQIDKATIKDNSVGFEGIYDSKNHTIQLNVDVSEYSVQYSVSSINYDAYYANNYSENYFVDNTSSLPLLINPGYYQVGYSINKENYNQFYGMREVQIYGVTGYDKTNLLIKNNMLIVRNYITNINDLFFKFNIFQKLSSTNKHLDRNRNPVQDIIAKTGEYFQIIVDNVMTNEYELSILGDVNGDGKISALDYVKIKNHIMKSSLILGNVYLTAADINEDAKISALDYVRIKNYIMNGGN